MKLEEKYRKKMILTKDILDKRLGIITDQEILDCEKLKESGWMSLRKILRQSNVKMPGEKQKIIGRFIAKKYRILQEMIPDQYPKIKKFNRHSRIGVMMLNYYPPIFHDRIKQIINSYK